MAVPQHHSVDELGDRFRIAKWCFDTQILDVYEGRDAQLDRAVHLRLLKPLVKRRPEAVTRFVDAAKSASAVVHPNLVAMFDRGWMGGRLCLVTEAPAHRLAESLRPLAPDELRRIAVDCLSALAAAHDADLLHGAIDEHAIFVEDDGTAKLADVGLYAAVATLLPRSRVAGDAEVGPSIDGDLRALAATLLRRSDGSDVSLDGVLQQALAVDPAARFGSAEAMLDALDAPGTSRTTTIPARPRERTETMEVAPRAATPVTRRRRKRNVARSVVAAWAVAAAAITALVVIAWHDDDPPTPGRTHNTTHQTSDLPAEVPR